MVDGSWLMVPTPCVATILALTHQVNITDVTKPWIDTMNHQPSTATLRIKPSTAASNI